jgi:hypothetical protein
MVGIIEILDPLHILNCIPILLANVLEEFQLTFDVLVFVSSTASLKNRFFKKQRQYAQNKYDKGLKS